jgi:hypothetical protein
MTAQLDTARNLRVSPAVLVGGYVDQRKGTGAVLIVRNELVHLDRDQCARVIEYLRECIREPPIPILPPTVLKEATK